MAPLARPVADALLAFQLNPTEEQTPTPSTASTPVSSLSKIRKAATNIAAAAVPTLFDNERPFAEPDYAAKDKTEEPAPPDLDAFTFTEPAAPEPKIIHEEPEPEQEPEVEAAAETSNDPGVPNEIYVEAEEDPEPIEAVEPEPTAPGGFTPLPKRKPNIVARWGAPKPVQPAEPAPFPDDIPDDEHENLVEPVSPGSPSEPEPEPPKLKLGIKPTGSQNELSLDSAPRGRFEGESPNVFDGEDLDLPPFLRKKK